MRKLLAAGLIVAGSVGVFAAPTFAFPKGEFPHVHCHRIVIDPDPPKFPITIRFTGTIGPVGGPQAKVDLSTIYGSDPKHPHSASVDDSAYTTAVGPLSYDITADGGTFLKTAHSSGTITCHKAPVTTTTSTSTSTSSTSTSTSTSTSSTSSSTSSTSLPASTTTMSPPPPALPTTGGPQGMEAVIGGGVVGLGLMALALGRKHNRSAA